jgi:cell division protease FtsH
MQDMEDAKDKVLMGPERRSVLITDSEKEIIAYHESGHATLGIVTGSDPIHKVTIIPRGRALGITMQLPAEEKHIHSKAHWLNQIQILYGGHLAEELKFGDVTTGSGNDISRASDIARRMVTEWGMSEKLGPISFGKKDEQIFLGREISQHRDFSESTAQIIDEEVGRIIKFCVDEARAKLRENNELFETLARSLIERETLDASEIKMIVAGEELPPVAANNRASE